MLKLNTNKYRIRKWALRGLLVLIAIIFLAFTYLYINKDTIARDILLDLNASTTGEIEVAQVNINPFVHFPHVSLSLTDTRLFETKSAKRKDDEAPILDIDQLYLSFDVIKLLRSRVEIERVSAINGSVYLTEDEKGVLNIEKALQPPKSPKITPEDSAGIPASSKDSVPSNKEKSKEKPAKSHKGNSSKKPTDGPPELDIKRLVLTNISIIAELSPGEAKQEFSIVDSKASFKYVQDSIACELDAVFKIDRLGLDGHLSIEEEELSTKLNLFFDKGEQELSVYQGDIDFRNTKVHTKGTINFTAEGMADLSFEAGDQNMAFTRLFLTAEGIDNLKSGQLYLKGTAKGPFRGQIPEILCSFGADNLTVEIPKTGDYIREVNIYGNFNSGRAKDLSEALIVIDTIHARLPTGYIRLASRLKNLKNPFLWYNLDASFRLENLGRIIDLSPIEDLHGRVTLKDSYRGALTPQSMQEKLIPEDFELQLDSIQFEIPGIVDIDMLDGSISGHIDSLNVDTLRIRSGDSDLVVHGAVRKFSSFLIQGETLVDANLKIKSDRFNFPYLFRALPKTAEVFPYVIRDVDGDVGIATNRKKLKNFNRVPEIDFEIREAAASVDSLLNYVRLREGHFKIHEDSTAFFLDFDGFKLLTDGTSSDVAFHYIRPDDQRDIMTFDLSTEGINPSQLLIAENDSVSEYMDAWLAGKYSGFMVLPFDKDSAQLFHSAKLNIKDFVYRAKDTISAANFHFKTKNVSYSGETSAEILSTLNSESELDFGQVTSSSFQADSLGLAVKTQDGVFSFSPTFHDDVGEAEEGIVDISFTEDPPKFSLDYTIKKLPLEEFLKTFYSEELLYGDVDIKLDLEATGLDLKSITSSLSGSIYVVGDSLQLQGLNLDEVIKDYQRSQSFNLVDIGAVVLAGPAGIVASKGSSYVALLTVDKNDSTLISKFSSKWILDSGKISVDDVAFATLKNRVAAQGWLDMKTDSLDFTIGVLNDKGCAIFDQRLYGSNEEPQYGKVKVLKTLLAPVTNVIKGAVGIKCDIFYEGIVRHPEKPQKEK